MNWKYNKKIGIEYLPSNLELNFGEPRNVIRSLLNFDSSTNFGRSEPEDSFENVLGSSSWIRLTFDQENKLDEIEILAGKIEFQNKVIEIGGDLIKTIESLKKIGCDWIESDYSYTDFSNLIDIGDSLKSGGSENEISWFYTSLDFSHLKN